jgi:S-DNA-T family DNA segregation ATPase FtsK/SpoIIIE
LKRQRYRRNLDQEIGMKRQLLELQADRIEAVLARHKVQAKVTGGCVAPRWVQFQVLPALGSRVNKIRNLADELALALDCDSCRVSRQGGTVLLQIPRSDPQPVRLLPLLRRLDKTYTGTRDFAEVAGNCRTPQPSRPVPFGSAVLGLAEDGAPLLVRLPSPQVAHILIAGTTGSGKSALAQTIIASLALSHRPSHIGLILIDPKRRAFGHLAGLPHLLRPVLSELEEIEETLEMLVALMLTRDREGRVPTGENSPGEPRVVVVIDEVADLLMMTGKATQQAITRLSQRGREPGIHLVVCTQKPASNILGGLAKANFPLRLVGRVTSPEDAKVATGYGGTGAEKLRGPGDFVAVSGGQIRRFQAAYISSVEINRLFENLDPDHRWRESRPNGGWLDVPTVGAPRRAAQPSITQPNRPAGNDLSELGRMRSFALGLGARLAPAILTETV